MEYTRTVLDPARSHLSGRTDLAPAEVFATMLALEDPAEVVASMVESFSAGGGTEWRVAWLTADAVTYCTARNPHDPDWTYDLSRPASDTTSVSAWRSRLEEITAIEVTAAQVGAHHFTQALQTRTVWQADAAGRRFTAPLFGQMKSEWDCHNAEQFMAELRKQWRGHTS